VRTEADLQLVDALVIPGGESTTMALVAERSGLLKPLQQWIASGRPVWVRSGLGCRATEPRRNLFRQHEAPDAAGTQGTCAGMIMIAKEAEHTKEGGQQLLGVMDIKVSRNYFGSQVRPLTWQACLSALNSAHRLTNVPIRGYYFHSQIDSFIADLPIPALGEAPFPAVFIRAPIVLAAGKDVEVLAQLPNRAPGEPSIVAVRQGVLLATAFHPELTDETRVHKYFVNMARGAKGLLALP